MRVVLSSWFRRILLKISSSLFVSMAPFFFPSPLFAQSVDVIDKSLPSVYLVYEKGPSQTNENGTVLFQLHNNTSARINVSANFDTRAAPLIEDGAFELSDGGLGTLLKSGAEVELCYDAEGVFVQKGYLMPRKRANPEVADLRNSCSYRSNGKRIDDPYSMGYWIRPNEFIRFRIPSLLLRDGLKVYTEFRYPWEFSNSRVRLNEPKHRVYFFYSDLPTRK